MKCPRAIAWQWQLGHKPQFSYGDCLKEECAWYGTFIVDRSTEATGCCLPLLTEVLSEIIDKTPRARE